MKRNLAMLTMGLLAAAEGGSYGGTSGPLPPQHAGGSVDPYLSDIATGMLEETEVMATQVFPVVNVNAPAGHFDKFDRGSLLRPEFRDHAYGDRPVQGSYKKEDGYYATRHKSLEKPVAPADRAAARDAEMPNEEALDYIVEQARMEIDLSWTRGFFNKDKWAFHYQGVSGVPNTAADTPEFLQVDQAGATPAQFVRGRVQRMKRMTGYAPNVLVMGVDVYNHLMFSPDIVDRIKYTREGIADDALMARYFGVDKILVADRVYNSAAEGLEAKFDYMVGSRDMLLVYANPRPSRSSPSAGYIFNWQRLFERFKGNNTQYENGLVLIRRGYSDRTGVDWVQGHTALGMEVVAEDLGMYFSDVVATSFTEF